MLITHSLTSSQELKMKAISNPGETLTQSGSDGVVANSYSSLQLHHYFVLQKYTLFVY